LTNNNQRREQWKNKYLSKYSIEEIFARCNLEQQKKPARKNKQAFLDKLII
jgi:hypothetical protein